MVFFSNNLRSRNLIGLSMWLHVIKGIYISHSPVVKTWKEKRINAQWESSLQNIVSGINERKSLETLPLAVWNEFIQNGEVITTCTRTGDSGQRLDSFTKARASSRYKRWADNRFGLNRINFTFDFSLMLFYKCLFVNAYLWMRNFKPLHQIRGLTVNVFSY